MKKLTDVNKCSRYYKLSIRSLNRQHSCHCTKPPSYKALSEELNKKNMGITFFPKSLSVMALICVCGECCSLKVQRGDTEGTASGGHCPPTQPSQYST